MNEQDLEKLLAARLQKTSPEFERRWTDLKRELRLHPRHQRGSWIPWSRVTSLAGLLGTGLAALALLFVLQQRQVPTQTYTELLELDSELLLALPLTNAEAVDTLLSMPLEMAQAS